MIINCECCLLPITIIVTRHLLEGDLEFTIDWCWDQCLQNSQVEGAQVQFIMIPFICQGRTNWYVGRCPSACIYSHHLCMGIVSVFYANLICYVIWFWLITCCLCVLGLSLARKGNGCCQGLIESVSQGPTLSLGANCIKLTIDAWSFLVVY